MGSWVLPEGLDLLTTNAAESQNAAWKKATSNKKYRPDHVAVKLHNHIELRYTQIIRAYYGARGDYHLLEDFRDEYKGVDEKDCPKLPATRTEDEIFKDIEEIISPKVIIVIYVFLSFNYLTFAIHPGNSPKNHILFSLQTTVPLNYIIFLTISACFVYFTENG